MGLLLSWDIPATHLCRLTMRDVDSDSGRVMVGSKGDFRGFPTYLGRMAMQALSCYLSEREGASPHDLVFTNKHGEQLSPRQLHRFIEDPIIRERSQVPDCLKLSHAFATDCMGYGEQCWHFANCWGTTHWRWDDPM